jgi:hypothetical protein
MALNKPSHFVHALASYESRISAVRKDDLGLQRVRRGRSACARIWLVEALTRAGRVKEVRLIFEQMLSDLFNSGQKFGGLQPLSS